MRQARCGPAAVGQLTASTQIEAHEGVSSLQRFPSLLNRMNRSSRAPWEMPLSPHVKNKQLAGINYPKVLLLHFCCWPFFSFFIHLWGGQLPKLSFNRHLKNG